MDLWLHLDILIVLSRKPAPPKPEELIAKLDEKFETVTEEILKSLEEKSCDINNLKEKDKELLQRIDENFKENQQDIEIAKKSSYSILEERISKVQR